MEEKVNVYYFDGIPTIGFCPQCEIPAQYNDSQGLFCPKCGNKDVSIFQWDGKSPHPDEANQMDEETAKKDGEEEDDYEYCPDCGCDIDTKVINGGRDTMKECRNCGWRKEDN